MRQNLNACLEMGHDAVNAQSLSDRIIAVPESREIELFAQLLEEHGARVLRCPLLTIQNAPNTKALQDWLMLLTRHALDDLILMTGEGIVRLLSFAREMGMERDAIDALRRVRKITRGPKPARILKQFGMTADLHADVPTTEGIIAALLKENMTSRSVGVQLYGDDPNERLISFLEKAGAIPKPVIAYIYAPVSDDQHCIELIQTMAAGQVDLIAFTSANQIRRLREVVSRHQLQEMLALGLQKTQVAAIGPVVAEELRRNFIRVDVVPKERFVLKQFVKDICIVLQPNGQ